MRAQIRRAYLPAGCWWIIHPGRGELIVILDEAVPRGSAVEQQLACMALQMWRVKHRRRGIGVFPASTAAACAVVLAVAAVSIVYVLTGDGMVSGPADGWAEGTGRPVAAIPVERRDPAPSAVAGPGRRRMVPSLPGGVRSGRPALAPTVTPTSTPKVRESARPVVRHPVRRLLRETTPARPRASLPVKVSPGLRPCELLKLRIGRCR